MKNKVTEWIDIIKDYYDLKQLAENYEQIKCKSITIASVAKAVNRNSILRKFYQIGKIVNVMPNKINEWILNDVFISSDITKLDEEKLKNLYEKASLSENKKDIVENNLPLLEKCEFLLSSPIYLQVLREMNMGRLTEEKLKKLANPRLTTFLNTHPNLDFLGLLMMNEKNRDYYMENYSPILDSLTDYYYINIQQMEPKNFKIMIDMVKNRYQNMEFLLLNSHTYEYLEELAQVYGDAEEETANFVFHAFPDFTDVYACGFVNGKIAEPFKALVKSITEENRKEALERLKEEYFHFLTAGSSGMNEIRYQTILNPNFIQTKNKEIIMSLLECKEIETYNNREQMLLESGIFRAEKLAREDYKFIKKAEKYQDDAEINSVMKKRLALVLTENFSCLPNKESIKMQIETSKTKEEEQKRIEMIISICEEENRKKLEQDFPPEKQEAFTDGDNSFVFCKNNTCKKS